MVPVSIKALHFVPWIAIGNVVPLSEPIMTCSTIQLYVVHDNYGRKVLIQRHYNIWEVNNPFSMVLPGLPSVVIVCHLDLPQWMIALHCHHLPLHLIGGSHLHQQFQIPNLKLLHLPPLFHN